MLENTRNMPKAYLSLFVENARNIPANESYVRTLETFGLFNGNNMNTFAPNSSVPNDIIPKEEDFIRVPFRLLTSTVVAAGSWRSTDFGDEAMLKRSMSKLIGKPIYVNHDTDDVLNNVGAIESVKWSPAKDGVPAGIDGMLKIDAKANPKIARSVLMNPPSIGSVSVTVAFDWEPSHKMEDMAQFENLVGTVVDKRMVTRKATDIEDYYEVSLVWLGADPYAKMRDAAGNLINIDKTAVFQNSAEQERGLFTSERKYIAKYCFQSTSIVDLERINGKNQLDNENPNNMKLNLTQLAAKAGFATVEEFSANLDGLVLNTTEEFKALKANADKVATLETTVTSLTAEKETLTTEKATAVSELAKANETVTSLTGEVTTLKATAEVGTKATDAVKAEAKRVYGIFSKGKPDPIITDMIDKAGFEQLNCMVKQYGGQLISSFKGSCKACKSEEIEFQSSVAEDGNQAKETVIRELSVDELHKKYGKGSMTFGMGE